MTEKGKLFLKEAAKNEALRAELNALNQEFEGKSDLRVEISMRVIDIAKKYGFALDDEDLSADHVSEVSDDEMKNASGGKRDVCCNCIGAGGGGGHNDGGETIGCACVAYGQGGDGHDENGACYCFLGGSGN